MMTRKECLDAAAGCVLKDRNNKHGKPEDSFETIAMMWSAYLDKIIQDWDVAAMMALLKIARIKANPAHADNWCDLAGYAACGAECRQKFEAEMKKTVEDAFETFHHLKPEAEGGRCQNGNDQPKFKPGDRVQVRMPAAVGDRWDDAVCVSILPEGTGVRVDCGDYKAIAFGWPNIRHAPKAEGCEDLVQKEDKS